MLIKVEPAEFFMFRAHLVFDLEQPDSEDQAVRDYLAERQLEPRHQSIGEMEGHHCEVMSFGGCYLGRHLEQIAQIQRSAVESEVLTEEVIGHMEAQPELLSALTEEQRDSIIATLVPQFHLGSAFQANEKGELIVALDGDAVREAARRIISASSF